MKKMNSLLILALTLIFALPFAAKSEAAGADTGAIKGARLTYADGKSFKVVNSYGEQTLELELLFELSKSAGTFEVEIETSFSLDLAGGEVTVTKIEKKSAVIGADGKPEYALVTEEGISAVKLPPSSTLANGFAIEIPDTLELEAGEYKIPIKIECLFKQPTGKDMAAFNMYLRKLSSLSKIVKEEEKPEKEEPEEGEFQVGFAANYNSNLPSSKNGISMQFAMANLKGNPIPVGGITMKYYFQANEGLDTSKFKFAQNRFQFLSQAPALFPSPNGQDSQSWIGIDEWKWWTAEVSKLGELKRRKEDGKEKTANYVLTIKIKDDIKIKDGTNAKIAEGKFMVLGMKLSYGPGTGIDFMEEGDWNNSYSYIDANDIAEEDAMDIDVLGYAHGNWPYVEATTAAGDTGETDDTGDDAADDSGDTDSPNIYEPSGDSGTTLFVNPVVTLGTGNKDTLRRNPVPVHVDFSSSLPEFNLHQIEIKITEKNNGKFYAWFMPENGLPTIGTPPVVDGMKITDSSGTDITGSYESKNMNHFFIRSDNPSMGDTEDGTQIDVSVLPSSHVGHGFYEGFDFMLYPEWKAGETEKVFEITVSTQIVDKNAVLIEDTRMDVYSYIEDIVFTQEDTVKVEDFKPVQ